MKTKILILSSALILSLTACSVGPRYDGAQYEEKTNRVYSAETGILQKEDVRKTVFQGENPGSKFNYATTASGDTKLSSGAIQIPDLKEFPWLGIAVVASGLLMLLLAGVLVKFGHTALATRAAVAGAALFIVALTAGSYGWMYALGIVGVAGLAMWEKWGGYLKGLKEAVSSSLPSTESADARQNR